MRNATIIRQGLRPSPPLQMPRCSGPRLLRCQVIASSSSSSDLRRVSCPVRVLSRTASEFLPSPQVVQDLNLKLGQQVQAAAEAAQQLYFAEDSCREQGAQENAGPGFCLGNEVPNLPCLIPCARFRSCIGLGTWGSLARYAVGCLAIGQSGVGAGKQ